MKNSKEKFYKVRREDGEVFEIKENVVDSHLSRGYELVDEEPVIRETNTFAMNNDSKADSPEESPQEPEDESKEEKDPEDMGYKELQSFVSANTEDYKVIGKKKDVLLEKAKEISS